MESRDPLTSHLSANAADGSDVGAFELQAAPNSPPVANDDSYQVVGGATLSPAAPGVLGNDTDPDGDPLTAQLGRRPGRTPARSR